MDMPRQGTWEERGGWVTRALATEFKLTLAQASGIVGNLGFESEGFETMQERGIEPPRGGWGWAQWTATRRRAFEAYAMAEHLAPASDEANYGYLVKELRESFGEMIGRLHEMATVEQAVWLVGQEFERPGGTTPDNLPGYAGRVRWATRALNGARPDTVPDVPTVDVAGAVRALQTALAGVNLYAGRIDADPGPQTILALQRWRAQQHG